MCMAYKQPKEFLKEYIKRKKVFFVKYTHKCNVHIITILSLFFNELVIYYLAPEYDPMTMLKQSFFKTSNYLI